MMLEEIVAVEVSTPEELRKAVLDKKIAIAFRQDIDEKLTKKIELRLCMMEALAPVAISKVLTGPYPNFVCVSFLHDDIEGSILRLVDEEHFRRFGVLLSRGYVVMLAGGITGHTFLKRITCNGVELMSRGSWRFREK